MATSLKKIYPNKALSTNEIIAMLKSRGLSIADEGKARQFLEDVTYFRLAAYLRPMEQDKQTHQYKPTATLENAIALYRFDNSLRRLIFSAIQTVEISLRTRMIKHFSKASDPFWFFDESRSNDKHKFVENISTIEREVSRTKEDFVKEHARKYKSNGFPPAWKTLELISLGCTAKLFFNYSDNKVKKRLARSYGIPQHEILGSWIFALNTLRNHCAHHNRLWNRTLPQTPLIPSKMRRPWLTNTAINPYRLYAALCCIVYWLNAIDSNNTFVVDFKELLKKYPMVDVSAMGFPANWQDEPLWK